MIKNLRHISYCIMASLLLVACRQESHPITPEEPEEQYAISMSASSDAMTTSRAIVNDDATLKATDLGVFAYKELADGTKVRVFDNERVYHNGSVWTYDNTKYWDRTAHYYFVSYSPHQDTDVEFDNGQLTIKNIPNWQTIDDNDDKAKDYVVADDHGEAQGGYITPNGVQPVPLAFKHILCQLEVRVAKNAFLSSEYTLSGISYTNVPLMGRNANYTYLFAGKDESGAAIEEAVGSMTLDRSGVSSDAQLMAQLNNVTVPSDPDADKRTTIKHLVVPFETNDNIKITLDYKVNKQKRDAVVDTQLKELEENKRYVLTLTFNSGAEITPTLQILKWVDVKNVDDDDKYNW